MKNNIKFLILPLAATLLASCQGNPSEESSSENSVSSEVTQKVDTTLLEVKTTINGCNVSGVSVDISQGIGTVLVTGQSYDMKVSVTDKGGDVTPTYSQEGIISFEKKSSETYTLKALKAGGVTLSLKDKDDITVYRCVINVRDPLAPTELTNFIVETVDHYETTFQNASYNYSISFVSNTEGVLKGKEEGNTYNASFTYTLGEKPIRLSNFYGYELNITMDETNENLTFDTSYISANGFNMLPFDKGGSVLGFFAAKF